MNKRLVIIWLVSLYTISMIGNAAELTNEIVSNTPKLPDTITKVAFVSSNNQPLQENDKDNVIDNTTNESPKAAEETAQPNHILLKTDKFYRIEQKQTGLLFVIQDFYVTGEKRTDSFTVADKEKAKRAAFDNISYEDMGVTGLFISWFKTGQIEQKGVFDQGLRKGLWVLWYENGQKKSSGRYKNGLRDGQWTTWYQNGKRMQKGIYRAGKREGVWIFWYGNGEKKEAGRYSDDQKVEKWSYWDQTGKMQKNDLVTDEVDD